MSIVGFIGYARVSTTDQDTGIQIKQLEEAGCQKVFHEQISGSTTNRPELTRALEFVREGDTLVITRIDRLARSMRDLQNIVYDLKQRGIHLKATEQPIDTDSAAGKAFLDMLGVFAEFETNLRRERQAEGIASAQDDVDKGLRTWNGRGDSKKVLAVRESLPKIREKLADGVPLTRIAKEYDVHRSTIYRELEKAESS